MPYDSDQVANLAAELDALESPTTEQVLAKSQDYDAGIVAAEAVQRAINGGGGGGGSQPGALAIADFLFNEPNGAHANLVATFDVPEGATVLDVWAYALVGSWDAATAKLNVADGAGKYLNDIDLSSSGVMWGNYDGAGGNNPAKDQNSFITPYYADQFIPSTGVHAETSPFWTYAGETVNAGGVLYPSGGTVTMTVFGLSSGAGLGRLLVRIVYAGAIDAVVAT